MFLRLIRDLPSLEPISFRLVLTELGSRDVVVDARELPEPLRTLGLMSGMWSTVGGRFSSDTAWI